MRIKHIAVVAFILSVSSCTNGCHKEEIAKPEPVDNVADIVERATQPIRDSLRAERERLQDTVAVYKKRDSSLVKQVSELKVKVKEAIRQGNSAITNNDTTLVKKFQDLSRECDAYMVTAEQQATERGVTIEKLELENKNCLAENELNKSNFKEVADSNLSLQKEVAEKELARQKAATERDEERGKKKQNGKIAFGLVVVAIIEGVIIYFK